MAVIVPMVSKKSASIRVKISSTAETTPTWAKPVKLTCPTVAKSGVSKTELGHDGTLRLQPSGL
jgi:hypothetical protein